jgi:2,3-bisphosphoglycerate-independent phosphoglycerate mutase
MLERKKVVLCILDGWGETELNPQYNALKAAKIPCYNGLKADRPYSLLKASGESVGLPDGQPGNSEVGHMTIGAGRVIEQDLVLINRAFACGEIFERDGVKAIVRDLGGSEAICHLIGIISDGGVHGHIEHILQMARYLQKNGVKVVLHAITDGRDVAPQSALNYLQRIKNEGIEVATLSGRFYAMDRDGKAERTIEAIEAIVFGNERRFTDPGDYISAQYMRNVLDEYMPPATAEWYGGFKEGDALIFMNYRADRMRQLAAGIMLNDALTTRSHTLVMSSYSEEIGRNGDVLFQKPKIINTIGEVISKAGLAQLRIAESEKYAHVTYFFNAAVQFPYSGEDRMIIPSSGDLDYSLNPKMSAKDLTDNAVDLLESGQYSFVCINYANPDMVGHTGNFKAAVEAVEYVDECLAALTQSSLRNGYELLVISDHGNVECMYDEKAGQPMTAHTTNEVPCVYIGWRNLRLRQGDLSDVAPTVLELLGIGKPYEMLGSSLIIG